MALVSCEVANVDDLYTDLLQLSQEEITVENYGSNTTLGVSTSRSYSVSISYESDDKDWLTYERKQYGLDLDFTPNNTVEERRAVVSVTVKDGNYGVSHTKSATIIQKRGESTGSMSIDGNLYEYNISGYAVVNKTLNIASNTDWELVSTKEWISLDKSSGTKNDKSVKVSIEKNSSYDSRSGTIKLCVVNSQGKKVATHYITVFQQGFPRTLSFSSSKISVPAKAATTTITFTTNMSWKAEVVNAVNTEWLTLHTTSGAVEEGSPKSVQLKISVKENTYYDRRIGSILIYSTEYGRDSNSYKLSVRIEQESAPVISARSGVYTKASAGEYSVDLYATTDWTATSDADWLTVLTPSGTANDGAIRYAVTKYEGQEPMRSAFVKIKANGYENVEHTISVTQDNENAFYFTQHPDEVQNIFYDNNNPFDAEISKYEYDESTREGRIVFATAPTKVGERAFCYQGRMTKIYLPKSITTFDEEAFAYCYDLVDLEFGDNITAIGEDAFRNCSSLTEITLPRSLTSLGDGVFSGCSALKSVVFEEGCSLPSALPVRTFDKCSALTSVKLPNVYEIGDEAFSGCAELESVEIPNAVSEIGNSAFRDCVKLKSVNLPEGLTSLKHYAFSGCSSLESITLPQSLRVMKDGVFSGCTSLKEIAIPGNITEICYGTFENCASLTKITLPSGLKEIGGGVFSGCTSVSEVRFNGSIANWCVISFYNKHSSPFCDSTVDSSLYCNNVKLTRFSEEVHVSSYAFYGYKGLKSVSLWSKNVYDYAFAKTGITSATIGKAYLGEGVFSECVSLQTVGVADSEYYSDIPKRAFYRCSSLKTVTVSPYSDIGEEAFYYCRALETISIKKTNSALEACAIGKYAFYNCDKLTAVYCSSRNLTVREDAFGMCKKLTTINPKYYTSIASYGFSDCRALTDISIKGSTSLCTIASDAFTGCSAVKTITLTNIASIGSRAFQSCSILETVTVNDTTPPSLTGATNVFPSVDKAYTIKVPSSSLSKYKSSWSDYASKLVAL